MRWLFENPWPLSVICALLIAMLIGGFLQTQRKWLLLVACGLAMFVAFLFVVEKIVVTPREEVARTLYEIAADLQVNNIDGVVRHFASTAPELERDARARLRGMTLEQVKIKRNLTIEVTPSSNPHLATARFNCVVVGSDKSGLMGKRRGAFFFDVDFRKEQGNWRVASYEMKDPRAGMRRNP